MIIRLKLMQALPSMVVLWSIVAVAPAVAQSSQRDGASTPAQPTILGPAMLRPGTADLSCGAGPAGLGPWGADRIEQTLSLDGAQRTKFNGLKTASQRAIQYLNESCPKNEPVTPTGRLEAMERRLSAMLEAVRTVQPALDDFYGALNDEQKARLTAIEPSDSTTSAPTDNAANTSTYRDRRGRVHQRHGGRPAAADPILSGVKTQSQSDAQPSRTVGWAKARSSRRAHPDRMTVGTLRFAHPT